MKVIDALVKIANGENIKFRLEDTTYFIKEGVDNELWYKNWDGEEVNVRWAIYKSWLNEEIELIPDILDEKEMEYLSTVIKPFRNSIAYIEKKKSSEFEEYIAIDFKEGELEDSMYFPNFKKGTMYEGMKSEKKYTLDDLGLNSK